MSWFNVGAVVIAVFFAVLVGVRPKALQGRTVSERPTAQLRGRVTPTGAAIYLLTVTIWVAGLAAPVIMPETEFANLVSGTWGFISLVAWSFLITWVLLVLATILGVRVHEPSSKD